MADAALSIAPSPAPMPVVADASATVAATTASEAGADPFASLLATLASTTAPVATAAAMPAVTPSPDMPVATLPTGPKDGTAAPSADPKAKASDGDGDDTPSDPDPLAAAIAAGATAVLAMAQIIPTPAPAPAKAAAPVVRAIATGATAKATDLPLTKEPAPADPAQQTAKPGAANTSAAAKAAPASGQAPTQPDAATITAILKALPIAAGANTDTPAPKKADQSATAAAATPQIAQPRADRAPPPPFAAGHNGGTAQPVAGKPARADDRRADAGDVTLPGLFTGPQHDAAALSGSASGPGQTAAPDSIVQQQLSIAQDGQWLDTLARDIAQTAGSGNDLHFKLDPQNLGSLTVSIAQGADGAAIRMSTDSADTRAILIDAQPKLVAEARAQGLRISEAHVDLSQSNSGSRGGDTWSGQSNAQANGQGQQSSTGRQPFMRNPEPMLAGGAGSDTDPDGLYA